MAPEDAPIVVDTNIIFSALLSVDSQFRAILFTTPQRFLVCETTIVELFELKGKLLALRPNRSEETLVSMLHALLRRVELAREDTITKEIWDEACELCAGVDLDDVPQVATALAVDGLLWTGDGKLKRALVAKGFTRFFTPSEPR